MIIKRHLSKDISKGYPEDKDIEFHQDRLLNNNLSILHDAIENHNTSAVILIDGRSGMGKTTLANQIGITLDKNYGLHKIHFSPEDFLNGLSNAVKGDCIVMDEAMIISSRSALSRINKMIVHAMSMIRSKQIYVIFNVNSIFDLERNLVLSRADILLHLFGDNLTDRGKYMAFFKSSDSRERIKELYIAGRKDYDYSKPGANFVARFTKEFVVDDALYDEKKDKGVNEFLQSLDKGHKKAWDKHLAMKAMKDKGFSNEEIADVFGMTPGSAANALYRLKSLDISDFKQGAKSNII